MSCCQTLIVEAIGHVAEVGHKRCGSSRSRPTLAFSWFLIRPRPGWDGLPIDALGVARRTGDRGDQPGDLAKTQARRLSQIEAWTETRKATTRYI
jgi:hypothetical protein